MSLSMMDSMYISVVDRIILLPSRCIMKMNVDTKVKIGCIYVQTFKAQYLVLRNNVFIHTCTENLFSILRIIGNY